MQSLPRITAPVVRITAWLDEGTDAVGHDPRSAYVEQFWLSTLGPSTTWLLRHLVARLERAPGGFDLDVPECARAIGLGEKNSKNSPFIRAFNRLAQFGLAMPLGDNQLAVRRKVPSLNQRQQGRLPESLQMQHHHWQHARAMHPSMSQLTERARGMALSLIELGEDYEEIERLLLRWRFSPATAQAATEWAWKRRDETPPSVTALKAVSETKTG